MTLKEIRKAKGFKQKDMAEAIEKSISIYSQKEKGDIEFNKNEIILIAKKLGLTMQDVNEIFFDGKLTNDDYEHRKTQKWNRGKWKWEIELDESTGKYVFVRRYRKFGR